MDHYPTEDTYPNLFLVRSVVGKARTGVARATTVQ